MTNIPLITYNNIIQNQLRLKIKTKQKMFLFDNINIYINHQHIDDFQNTIIMEGMYFKYLLSFKKSFFSFFKKKYKEYDIITNVKLSKQNCSEFLLNYICFYFPILKRREILFKKKESTITTYIFSCNSNNIFPFMPDLYFSFLKKIICIFKTNIKKQGFLILVLKYLNFPFFFEK